MKIRLGFISNSSSSSFIIELEKPIEQYSYQEFEKDYDIKDTMYGMRLFQDLNNKSREIKDMLEDKDLYDIQMNWNLNDYIDYEFNEQLVKKLNKYADKLIKQEIKKKYFIEDNSFTRYELEYDSVNTFSDADKSYEMEQEFMPNFKGTISCELHH